MNKVIISKKKIFSGIIFADKLFKYLLKLSYLIFFEKKYKNNKISFLEIKLGKRIITEYLYSWSFNETINEAIVILCIYNNKFIRIFIKYIKRFLFTFLFLKSITKRKILFILFKLIGFKVVPFFFIRNKSNKIKNFFLSITNHIEKLYGVKIIDKCLKQIDFYENKGKSLKIFRKKIINWEIYVLDSNNFDVKNYYYYNLFLTKITIIYGIKKIKLVSFVDSKNLMSKK